MKTFIHPTSVIDEGASIGEGTHIWHFCHLMPGSVVGDSCNIGQNVFIDSQGVLGNRVKVQNNVSIYKGVVIEDDVFVGPSVVFTNVINPRSFIDRKSEIRKTVIRHGATIGANATIVCGVEVGEYAFIGAGAVVTKNVRAFELVTGIPAGHAGWVSKQGLPLHFSTGQNVAVCPEEGSKYLLSAGSLSEIG